MAMPIVNLPEDCSRLAGGLEVGMTIQLAVPYEALHCAPGIFGARLAPGDWATTYRQAVVGCDQPGIFGKRFIAPCRSTHDCALSQNISIPGFTQLESSSVPEPSITTSGSASASSAMDEPHSGQNIRWIDLPVSPVLLYRAILPSIFTAGFGTPSTVENALPVNFWQSVQWQTPTKAGSPVAL